MFDDVQNEIDNEAVDIIVCLLSNCSEGNSLQLFKVCGIKKLIDCSTERHDDKFRSALQATIYSQGDRASVGRHEICFCSYTSKDHVRKVVARKTLHGLIDSDEPPTACTRRSEVKEFNFKKQCLFCAKVCNPVLTQTTLIDEIWCCIAKENVLQGLKLLRMLF